RALMLEVLLGPGLAKNLLGFLQTCLGLVMVDAETLIIVNIVRGPAAEADHQAPFCNIVEDCQLLSKADGMMQRGLNDCEADLAVPGRGCQCRSKTDRVDIGTDSIEMMLRQPDHVDAELVGKPSLSERFIDHDAVPFGVSAVWKQKIAEFHGG